jgi:hypothetical protein
MCRRTFSVGDRVTGSTITDEKCGITAATFTIQEKFINSYFYAPQMNLIQTSGSKASKTDEAGEESGSSDGDNLGQDEAADGSGGLSKTAIIAIAICVPLVLIAVGIATFIVVRRKKRAAKKPHPTPPNLNGDATSKPELEGAWGAATSPAINGATGVAWTKPELYGATSTTTSSWGPPSELRGSEAPGTYGGHIHEMRGSDYLPPELAAEGPGATGQQWANHHAHSSPRR